MSQLTEEELLVKHKKERKDLQAQIQSIKKSCAKGDKKKKKEAAENIARLEQELDERQNKELDEISTPTNEATEATLPPEDNQVNETPADVDEEGGEEDPDYVVAPREIRVTKAQKRRNKKAAEEKSRDERIQKQEKQNKKGPRLIETDKINEKLKEMDLKIYSIPADGNCLYCSVNHQLSITGRDEYSVAELRKITADYMRSHKDDILPFMSTADGDDVYTEEHYEKYCNKVETTTEWGGQIEILALSNVLKCPIKIIQATTNPTLQGEQFEGEPLILTYHRHLYRLGEHYNSTIPI